MLVKSYKDNIRCGDAKFFGYHISHIGSLAHFDSYEIGYKLAIDAMGLQPIFLLGMRLGEGSGCPLAFEVLSAACAILNDMATFDQAGIDDGYLDEIREGDKFTVEGAT